MKKLVSILVVLLSVSCQEEENNTPTAPVNDSFDPMKETVMELKKGTFTGVGHSVSGTATVYDDAGKLVVVLDPFSTQNGPDLKLYLSTDQSASQYINLGDLKSTTGKQSYEITGTTDLAQFKFVLVWCQDFSVLFGKAELQ
ncbi:MAG: DM13 domain-containing protein [Flammeovirgaceae bacterium]|nr:DM13 domain-containing protein [Flammeovirgaceae bacterium]